MKILIKYATRGRSEWFKKAITNIIETIGNVEFKILVSADIDDPDMANDRIIHFCNSYKYINLIFGNSHSKIHAINRDMEHSGDWDILINMSDDMFFTTPRWGQYLIQCIQNRWGNSLDFFAHFNDGYAGEALATMSIIGLDYFKRDGYIYYPEYKSFSCDAEAYYVAILRGCHHYFPNPFFLHQHPANSKIPYDETYRKNSLATAHDTELYFKRLNMNFGETVNSGEATPFDKFKTIFIS